MAGIPSLSSALGPPPNLPGAAIPLDQVDGPVESDGFVVDTGEGEAPIQQDGDVLTIDLSNKSLERQLVFTSVQSQDQQQTTVTEDGTKKSDSQNTSVTNEGEAEEDGSEEAEDDGPPPTPPDLSALNNPFFQRASGSSFGGGLGVFGAGRPANPFQSSAPDSVNQSRGGSGIPQIGGSASPFPALGVFRNRSVGSSRSEERTSPNRPVFASTDFGSGRVNELKSFADAELARSGALADSLSQQFSRPGGFLDLIA